jgi:hypothetical protein
MNAVGQTDVIRAGGIKPLFNPLMAHIAFAGDAFGRIKGDGIIGAGIDTQLASAAHLLIQNHDSIISLSNGLLGTGIHTFRRLAVSTDIDVKYKVQFIANHPGSFFLDRNESDPVGRMVLLFTGHLTGSAAPAEVMVNNKRIFRH